MIDTQDLKDKIESHLRNYQQYKIGIRNLELQLESMMPKLTASYDLQEGTVGTFIIKSSTETYTIKTIEMQNQLKINQLIVNCIDEAMKGLDEKEKEFVEYRYFSNFTIKSMALTLGYSESTLYNLRIRVLDKLVHSLKGLEQY